MDIEKIKGLIEGLRCETCSDERVFGHPPNSKPDNLYVYTDLGGATRCFCIKHITFYTKDGAMVNYKDKTAFVGYGAKLISEILKDD